MKKLLFIGSLLMIGCVINTAESSVKVNPVMACPMEENKAPAPYRWPRQAAIEACPCCGDPSHLGGPQPRRPRPQRRHSPREVLVEEVIVEKSAGAGEKSLPAGYKSPSQPTK